MHKTLREVMEETARKAREAGNCVGADRLQALISWADAWAVASLVTEVRKQTKDRGAS